MGYNGRIRDNSHHVLQTLGKATVLLWIKKKLMESFVAGYMFQKNCLHSKKTFQMELQKLDCALFY